MLKDLISTNILTWALEWLRESILGKYEYNTNLIYSNIFQGRIN